MEHSKLKAPEYAFKPSRQSKHGNQFRKHDTSKKNISLHDVVQENHVFYHLNMKHYQIPFFPCMIRMLDYMW